MKRKEKGARAWWEDEARALSGWEEVVEAENAVAMLLQKKETNNGGRGSIYVDLLRPL
jgi:hypothetical protein